MPFWSKYTDPPTSMICGFKKEHMLISNYLVIVGPKPLKAKINRILERSVYSKGSTLYASVIL